MTSHALDTFCQLALESDLSDAQLTHYARLVRTELAPELGVSYLIDTLRTMSALDFAAAVKRAANGSATSTSSAHRWFPYKAEETATPPVEAR